MKIKTTSQVTPIGEGQSIHLSAYFNFAQYSDSDPVKHYYERGAKFGDIQSQICKYIDDYLLSGQYNATMDDGSKIDLQKLRRDVTNLSSESITVSGVKTFNDIPSINAAVSDYTGLGHQVPNIDYVNTLIVDKSGYINSNSSIERDPGNANGYTQYYDDGNDQLHWNIEHNTRESDVVTVVKTGNLICYGWLADNSNVKAENAWVALFGEMKLKSDNTPIWVALQVQPWIVGKYSSTAQYVGFNIQVREGLKLKIMTGFPVNGNNSGLQSKPTLMFADRGNIPNSFVGYII